MKQIRKYARESLELGASPPDRTIRFLTKRGPVDFLIVGSVIQGETHSELIPCAFISPDPDDPDTFHECIIPSRFEYSEPITPKKCMKLMIRWCDGLAEYIISVDEGRASSAFGSVTGYSSAYQP
jgi:hypothetical protein